MRTSVRFGVSLLVLAGVFHFLPGTVPRGARALIAWNAGVITHLSIVAYSIVGASAQHVRAQSQRISGGRYRVLAGVLLVCVAGLVAIVFVLNSIRRHDPGFRMHLLLCVATVCTAWTLLQITFALFYARSYYQPVDGGDKIAGGLRFAGEAPPDYGDFIYFSCVIGTSYSTSDTNIESRMLRRAVLVQSLVSFLFYTVLIGLVMNTIGALF